jgi:SAM-dependent methyltransferase
MEVILHRVITCDTWEKEFERLRFENKFPPPELYPNEKSRVSLVLSSIEKYGGIKLLHEEPLTFEYYRNLIHSSFHVTWTAISRPLERFLFFLSFKFRPKLTLVVGCGEGTAVGFLAASLENIKPNEAEIIGIDINSDMIDIARRNIKTLNLKNIKVDFLAEDAHQSFDSIGRCIDLLFLDADGNDEKMCGYKGKKIYESLILKALPYLCKDSLVLAHDVRWAKLSGEIDGYLSLVRNLSLFSFSIEVRFDIQGLEISRKGDQIVHPDILK